MRTRIVMLSQNDPSPSVESLLQSPFYQNRITYVRGNPLNFPAMAKARLDSAMACFIMSHYREGVDIPHQDSTTVMQALVSIILFIENLKLT